MKKLIIPLIAVIGAVAAMTLCACGNEKESEPPQISTTAAQTTFAETTTEAPSDLPKITEPVTVALTEIVEDGTAATYPNGMKIVAVPDETTVAR